MGNNEINFYPSFSDFWNAYDKKINSKGVKLKWDKLTQKTKEDVMEHLPYYVKSTPIKKYRLHPSTYINQEAWKNEIISNERTTEHDRLTNQQSQYITTREDI